MERSRETAGAVVMKKRARTEYRPKPSAAELWKRAVIWIFIFLFIFSVAGGVIAFSVTR